MAAVPDERATICLPCPMKVSRSFSNVGAERNDPVGSECFLNELLLTAAHTCQREMDALFHNELFLNFRSRIRVENRLEN